MHEPLTDHLERSPTVPSLAPQAARVVPASDRRGPRRQRRGGQPVDDTRPPGRLGGLAPSPAPWSPAPTVGRAARPAARTLTPWPRSVQLPGTALDPRPH